jgi:heat-inducible transcriptional repressor
MAGRNLVEVRGRILDEIEQHRTQLDELTEKVVSAGLATWTGDPGHRDGGSLIVRGQAKLLEDVTNLGDLERIRALFEMLDARKAILRLVEVTQSARSMQIFIGAENQLFNLSGCAMIVAPYTAGAEGGRGSTVVGAIGVIGPTRMNYARIIPLVDYTARVVSRLLGSPDTENRR